MVDLCPTPYINMRDYLTLKNQLNPPEISRGMSSNDGQEFTRYRINEKTKVVTSAPFPNTIKSRYQGPGHLTGLNPLFLSFINVFDFPTINEVYRGKSYCVVYGWAAIDYSRMALVKKNVCDSTKDQVKEHC